MRNAPRPTRARSGAALLLCSALTLAFFVAGAARAAEQATPRPLPDFQKISLQATDSTQAKQAVKALRDYLAASPESAYIPFSRIVLVQALLTSKAPTAELLAAIDQAEKVLPDRVEAKVSFYATLARSLVERGVAFDRASAYAAKAVALCPRDDDSRKLRSLALSVQGQVQLAAGRPADAAISLNQAVADSPDSQAVLAMLGTAYEKSGRSTNAVDAYLRSAACFPGRDTTALAPLRALWKKQHGSLAGLDERIATLRKASVRRVALDTHAVNGGRAAPSWRLPDLEEKIHDLASYKGRVLVMDFWGSWCGPCRQELPLIEAMYRRYKDNPKVAFVGVNWERAQGAEEHRALARDYAARNDLTFTIVYDHERNAVGAYQIQGFPTVFLVDRAGVLRYVNLGFDPNVDQILEAQIQSLLD